MVWERYSVEEIREMAAAVWPEERAPNMPQNLRK
jgi:hypothetical protein